jgi:uncharacterized protein (TIGR02996 family)
VTGDRDAFLRAIADSPGDQAPILIYADWLEDRGEEGQSGLIRHWAELVGGKGVSPPPSPALRFYERTHLGHPACHTEWFLGTVQTVYLNWPHWNYLAQCPLEEQPVRRLRLDFTQAVPGEDRLHRIPVPRAKLPYLRTMTIPRMATVSSMGTRGRGVRGNSQLIPLHENFRLRWVAGIAAEWPGVKVEWAD